MEQIALPCSLKKIWIYLLMLLIKITDVSWLSPSECAQYTEDQRSHAKKGAVYLCGLRLIYPQQEISVWATLLLPQWENAHFHLLGLSLPNIITGWLNMGEKMFIRFNKR